MGFSKRFEVAIGFFSSRDCKVDCERCGWFGKRGQSFVVVLFKNSVPFELEPDDRWVGLLELMFAHAFGRLGRRILGPVLETHSFFVSRHLYNHT